MGLSPKPSNNSPLKTWEDLDRSLQSSFKFPTKEGRNFTFVNPDWYEMSKQEIIDEGIKQGYKVTDLGDQLKFE